MVRPFLDRSVGRWPEFCCHLILSRDGSRLYVVDQIGFRLIIIDTKTKAILPVHVFGHPCDMDAVMDLANRRHLTVVEDACEALGSAWRQKMAGTFGSAGVYAFYPNKQITTCEGGVIVTDDADLAALLNYLLTKYSAATLPESFSPYDAREVSIYRRESLLNPVESRAKLLGQK